MGRGGAVDVDVIGERTGLVGSVSGVGGRTIGATRFYVNRLTLRYL